MSIIDSNCKKDLRVIKTHRLLINSLLELLSKSSFDDIHVKDICENAMVNRSTFYQHFEDKYHLLTYALQNIIDLISPDGDKPDDIENTLKNIFEHIASFSSSYSKIILDIKSKNIERIFQQQIAQKFKESFKKRFNDSDDINFSFTVASQFYAGALLSVISWWLENDMSTPIDEICKELTGLALLKHSYFTKDNNLNGNV